MALTRKRQAHVEAEGPRRGFSGSGWNESLPRTPKAHSSWEFDQQSLTSIMATKATMWRSTKTETTQVSPLGLRELDLKNEIFNSSEFSVNSVANGGGGGGGGGGGLIAICILSSEPPDAIAAVCFRVAGEQLWGAWFWGNRFWLAFTVAEYYKSGQRRKSVEIGGKSVLLKLTHSNIIEKGILLINYTTLWIL